MRFIAAAALLAFALPGLAAAQDYYPWPGYQPRNIVDLRKQAIARRDKLREIAHEARRDESGTPSGVVAEGERAGMTPRRPAPRPLPVWKGPALKLSDQDRAGIRERFLRARAFDFSELSDEDFGPSTTYDPGRSDPDMRPGRKPKIVWKGVGLSGTSEDARFAYLSAMSDAAHTRGGPRIFGARLENGYFVALPQLRAMVDVTRQRMTLIDGGEIVAEWPVSTGRRGYESGRGVFGVSFLSRNHKSSIYNNAPMPCAVFYNGGEAIHGTNQTWRLGQKASHGCVRLETANACMLHDMVRDRGKGSLTVEVFD